MHEGMKKALIAGSDKERDRIMHQILENQADTKLQSYEAPETDEQWWQVVSTWWDDLLLIMERFLPMSGFADKDGGTLSVSLREHIIKLKQNKDRKLAWYLDSAWCAAPDHGSIHAIKGWGVLCDLCSEQHVLYTEEEENALRETQEKVELI